MLFKSFLVACFCLLSAVVCCQKPTVDVVLVNTKNDTIRSEMIVYPNLFSKKQVDERSFFRTAVLLMGPQKRKTKIKAGDIKFLSFVDFAGQRRIYLNNGNMLQRLMYEGKVKWYRRMSQNLYDGSLLYHERFISENGDIFDVKFNLKKKLKDLTKSNPGLADEIENMRPEDEAILHILKKYDSDQGNNDYTGR